MFSAKNVLEKPEPKVESKKIDKKDNNIVHEKCVMD